MENSEETSINQRITMSSTPTPEEQSINSPTPPESAPTVTPGSSVNLHHTLISLSAAIMVLSFFLPWIPFLGVRLNGMDVQKNFSSYWFVWLMPLLALVALILNMANQNTNFVRRIAGLFPFAILAYATNRLGNDLVKHLEFGAWLGLLAGVALVLIPGKQKPTTPV